MKQTNHRRQQIEFSRKVVKYGLLGIAGLLFIQIILQIIKHITQ